VAYAKFEKPMLYIPHGISEAERHLRPDRLTQIEQQWGRNYLLFVGTLNPDVDLELLQQLAEQFDQQLLLIGPNKLPAERQAQFEALVAKNNVAYLGVQKATDLKEYVALAAVGLVPYQQKRSENVHRTPLKLLNYLAQATPIVTTLNYELKQFNGVLIYPADSKAAFLAAVAALLQKKQLPNKAAAAAYCETVLYPVLLQKILQHV
jgi:glycosyltransferase involved in cell wall biosynthesis